VGAAARTANGDEATHGERRIDFVFYKGDAVELTSVQTIDTSSWFGGAASDHRPLVATFQPTRMIK
jgi:endonuclease/exonuclease/phosphatase (EEP) superfamily protein YafD